MQELTEGYQDSLTNKELAVIAKDNEIEALQTIICNMEKCSDAWRTMAAQLKQELKLGLVARKTGEQAELQHVRQYVADGLLYVLTLDEVEVSPPAGICMYPLCSCIAA